MARKTRKQGRRQTDQAEFLDSILFRLGTRLFVGVVIVVIFLTLAQCTVKTPESPEWTTNLTVPVVSRTYPMQELIDRLDEDGVTIDSANNVTFSISEEIDTFRLDQTELTIDDIDTLISEQIGVIELNGPSLAPVAVSFASIVGLAVGVVPPSSFDVDNDMPTISTFSSASLVQGRLWVVVDNRLGVDLDTAVVGIWDVAVPSSPVLLSSRQFVGGLPDGTLDSLLFDFSGSTISNELEVRVHCYTPGGTVLSSSGKELVTAIHFNEPLSVSSATNADVPSLTVADTSLVGLTEPGETDVIHQAVLGSGEVALSIRNNTPVDATVSVTLPDLRNGGTPLVIQQPVAAFNTGVTTINVTGYVVVPSDLTAPQEMSMQVEAVTIAGRVDIDQSQDFEVTASLTSLAFDAVTGAFSATEATITPTTEQLDIPDGFDGFSLETATLTIDVENAVQMPGFLDVTLVGDNGKSYTVTGTVDPATVTGPTNSLIVDNNAADFLTPLPTQVDISGTVTFGDGSVATITTNDYVQATVDFSAPLAMVVTESTIEGDVEGNDIDAEDMEVVTQHVEELRFIYQIDNSMPLGLTANLYLAKNNNVSALTNDLAISNMTVEAAPHLNGFSTGLTSSLDTIYLTNADVQILDTDSLFFYTEFVLASSDGQVVRLTGDNAVTIVGRFEVAYRFDGEF